MRPLDEHFPADERIFRGLKRDWVKGSQVLAEAIDIPKTSVGRSRYGRHEDVVSPTRTGIGEASVGAYYSQGQVWVDTKEWPYTCELQDSPDEGDHHAHIAICVAEGRSETDIKPSKTVRRTMREDLAAPLRVVRPPD